MCVVCNDGGDVMGIEICGVNCFCDVEFVDDMGFDVCVCLKCCGDEDGVV